jgi:Na+/H+ antiporter NhaB
MMYLLALAERCVDLTQQELPAIQASAVGLTPGSQIWYHEVFQNLHCHLTVLNHTLKQLFSISKVNAYEQTMISCTIDHDLVL